MTAFWSQNAQVELAIVRKHFVFQNKGLILLLLQSTFGRGSRWPLVSFPAHQFTVLKKSNYSNDKNAVKCKNFTIF